MDKWTRKYLKLAKTLADDNTACYSRKIGVVLVSPSNRIISLGYNGTVEGVPHPDTREYLTHLYENLFTQEDKQRLEEYKCKSFVDKYEGCQTCPRRLLNIPSGQRLELCPCAHAERNALASANQSGVSTAGSIMYCYCGVPCHECTTVILQAGVSKIVCLKTDGDYSPSSRGLISMSNTELIEVEEKEIWE